MAKKGRRDLSSIALSNIDESKILVTGGSGYLGGKIKLFLPFANFPSRKELDVTKEDSVNSYFKNNEIEIVIHLAAMASIPLCEKSKKEAYDINVNGTRRMLSFSKKFNIKQFVYLSTACVFSGDEENVMYSEEDIPNPKHFYGLTKLLGEEIAKSYNSEKMLVKVIRTNFAKMPWQYPKAFIDRFGTYLFGEDVAFGLKEIIIKKTNHSLIHLCGNKKMSMFDYALSGGSNVQPMNLEEYHGVPLTKNMCLTSKYWKLYTLGESKKAFISKKSL